MYAVIECGGKQYRVEEGDELRVEKLAIAVGSTVDIEKVLLIGGDNTVVGAPYVTGATVIGKVLNHGKEKKILVFHYKAKKNVRSRYGHRQPFTSLLIEKIKVAVPSEETDATVKVAREETAAVKSGGTAKSKKTETGDATVTKTRKSTKTAKTEA